MYRLSGIRMRNFYNTALIRVQKTLQRETLWPKLLPKQPNIAVMTLLKKSTCPKAKTNIISALNKTLIKAAATAPCPPTKYSNLNKTEMLAQTGARFQSKNPFIQTCLKITPLQGLYELQPAKTSF